MTDEEWKKNVKAESNERLLKDLIYFGHDNYYDDMWEAVIKELCRRLKVSYKNLYK